MERFTLIGRLARWWLGLSVFGMAAVSGPAAASVTLTISALRGGTLIDLGEIGSVGPSSHEEVTVRITNAEGSQYRITQAVSQTLTNEHGATLEPSAVMMELDGGEGGTLKFQGAVPMPGAVTELFTSASGGEPETLKILYSISMNETLQAGTYTGALTFTLQAADGSDVDTQTLPVRLLVYPTASLSPAPGFPGRLVFGSMEPGQGTNVETVALTVTGSASGPLQLVQRFDEPLTDEQGHELPSSALLLSAAGPGVAVAGERPVEPMLRLWSREESAAPSGQRVELAYRVIVPESQPAGSYRGLVHLELEGLAGPGHEPGSFDLPLELEVLPLLSLAVEAEAGKPAELVFGGLTPGTASKPEALLVNIRTNTGRPYEVHQELSNRLMSDEGRQLPETSIRCAMALADGGVGAATAMAPMMAGRSSVYRSDERGSPARFSVTYQLEVPVDASAGVYHSRLVFTVTSF